MSDNLKHKTELEVMIEGMLDAAFFQHENLRSKDKNARVTLRIEKSLYDNHIRLIDTESGTEGDPKRNLLEATANLYAKLVARATEEESKALSTLRKLGARDP